MAKYKISWWTCNGPDESRGEVPFHFYYTGSSFACNDAGQTESSCVADFESLDDEEAIWRIIRYHFPDFIPRFCNQKPDNWNPGGGDRFTNSELYQTSISHAFQHTKQKFAS